MTSYPIIRVPDDAVDRPEALGSKPKFWYRDTAFGDCLYKQSRESAGEDWSEKVAAELAELLGLPHARVELATWRHTSGIVSPSFVPPGGQLILGNEVLFGRIKGYPRPEAHLPVFRRVPQHTVGAVLESVEAPDVDLPPDWTLPAGLVSAADVFVGYLMLDAWIGNTDRHHENWALMRVAGESRPRLAPTYDHASSLGRNEPDERRNERMLTHDRGRTVRAYVEKATSALYADEADERPLRTIDAFSMAARQRPQAAQVWLARLRGLTQDGVRQVVGGVPASCMSETARRFALQILDINRERLLSLPEALR